ncbi:S8 family serine peptidase [Streptomyces sp. NRRL S-87]|uniref:S8 family serine peptidase n=1 Tax=Streptomyces sp. NRRL S-87 TaxID=1463920 RepID=UPI0004C14F2D|nr:S8 family serine peptidase [Streptomyces sp. NRRL S-87]
MANNARTPRRLAAVTVTTVALAGTLTALPGTATAKTPDPNQRVIVELAGAAAVAAAPGGSLTSPAARTAAALDDARRALAARQDAFLGTVRSAGLHPAAPRRLGLLLNAVAMTVPASERARLATLPGVLAVRPDTRMQVQTDTSVPLTGAPEVWKRRDPAGVKATGKGTVVAVLDSGVDYGHPDLGAGFGKGHKVVGGFDFANGDDDPMDDNGHGTHVAGIIAGKAAGKGGVTGMAPDASLLAYKVTGPDGSGYTSDIIAGIEAAADPANPHPADVINMSLGGPGDGTDPLGRAASAAVRAGVVVVAAAGNNGPGTGTVSTPASAAGVIAVGASTSGIRTPSAYLAGRNPELIQTYRGILSANPPREPVTAPLVDVGAGTAEDWRRVGDVRGKILRADILVPPGTDVLSQYDIDWAREAERRGALAVLGGLPAGSGPVLAATPGTVQAQPGPARPDPARTAASGDSLRMDHLVVMGIDATQYAQLSRELAAGKVSVTLRGTDATDRIASFSSRGPGTGFGLKPDLVAPGVEIRSTIPTSLYRPGVYRMSGTSMASPHVAGAAALLRQLRPDQGPEQIRSALVGTAKPLAGTGPTVQGNGRLDVAAAASATLGASPTSVSFGLADLGERTVGGTARVRLTNPGRKPLAVALSSSGPTTVSPSRLTVPAGRSATVEVTLRAARPATDREIGGRITATPDRGPAVRVPYLLVVRHLAVQASPDPSDGRSTVHVASPAALNAPPQIRVTPPHGRAFTLPTTMNGAGYYQADVRGTAAGAYRLAVRATTTDGRRITGTGAFEVTPADSRRDRWEPVGPNSEAGHLALSPARPKQAVVTQFRKAAPWLTTDGGAHWRQVGRLPIADGNGTGAVVVDARRPDRWWYAVNTAADPTRRGTVLRTDDNGRTWRRLDVPDAHIDAFVADERTRTLAAIVDGTLLVSTDAGERWATYPTGVSGGVREATLVGDTLYLATFDSVWRIDGVGTGDPATAHRILDEPVNTLRGMAADSEVVVAYVPGTGVRGSYDKGRTWSTLLRLPEGGNGLSASGGDLYLRALFGAGQVSRDHGRTWTPLSAPSKAAVAMDYDRWADGSVTVSSEQDGLYRGAADGTGYRRIGVQGLTTLALATSGGHLLAGTVSGTYRTAIPVAGPEWGRSGAEGMTGRLTSHIAVSPRDTDVVWQIRRTATGLFEVSRSADAGRTWKVKGTSSEVPTSMLIHPADPDRVAISFRSILGDGLFATSDGGRTWKNLFHERSFDAMAGDPRDPRRLWLGNASGLYRSDDGGVTKTKVAEGPVSALVTDGRRLVVGGSAVRVSTDGGRTFRTADTGPLAVHVSDLLRVGGALYAATTASRESGLVQGGRGVLRSTDNGLTWENISSGLQNTDTTKLAAAPDGRTLYVGTVDGGVHRLNLRR